VVAPMSLCNSKILKPYGSCFSKPQFVHFEHIITCLSACEIPSLNRFAALHTKSRSSLNRFLTESTWKSQDVKNIYHQELHKYLPQNSYLLIDDTLSHRPYAKAVEKANYHYDHTINGQSLGYSLVTSTAVTNSNIIPYDLIAYYRKENCTDRKYRSKNEIAEEIILSSENIEEIDTVIFDSWYSNDIVIGACKKAGKHYITMLKSNRNVTFHYKKYAVDILAQKKELFPWEEFQHDGRRFRTQTYSVFIHSIGSVILVISQIYDNAKKKWGDKCYLISDMIDKLAQELVKEYLVRSGIESFHREAKQNIGLEGYFLRNNRGIERYLFLVMLTYALLIMQSIEMKENISIGRACEKKKQEIYYWAMQQAYEHPSEREFVFQAMAKARV
jgi:hypothetical protein